MRHHTSPRGILILILVAFLTIAAGAKAEETHTITTNTWITQTTVTNVPQPSARDDAVQRLVVILETRDAQLAQERAANAKLRAEASRKQPERSAVICSIKNALKAIDKALDSLY